MASIHTIFPGYRDFNFFSDENIVFIHNKIIEVLKGEFFQDILFDRASIVRIMERVQLERKESIPKMNQRVVMICTNEYRSYQALVRKRLKYEEGYVESQRLYDPTVERGPDFQNVKLANRLGKPRVGGTVRFYFT